MIAFVASQKLCFYGTRIVEGELHRLSAFHVHNIAAVAYNMCIGAFGRAVGAQICVQNLNCSLVVFEGEHQLFHRSVTSTAALYPGPIVYAPQSDSIVAASSSGILASYKYSTLATASSGSYGKKISVSSFLTIRQ